MFCACTVMMKTAHVARKAGRARCRCPFSMPVLHPARQIVGVGKQAIIDWQGVATDEPALTVVPRQLASRAKKLNF